jgi:hypothetical protein
MYNKDPGTNQKFPQKKLKIMKKTMLLFSFALVLGFAQAQDYVPIPTDNVVWSELYY